MDFAGTDLISTLAIMLVCGIVAGGIGSLLGIGGGMIVTPVLTILFGIDIKYTIAASLIVVIATSSGSTIAYLKDKILNLRAAMFLEIFTSLGGICGALLSGILSPIILYVLFGILIINNTIGMLRKLIKPQKKDEIITKGSKSAEILKLNGTYYDVALKKQIDYSCKNVAMGSFIMYLAGIASGLLGIGSGVFKVIAMDGAMKMPLKVSTSTSNLMMGVTACASALIYFMQGQILCQVAVPVALGVLIGATIGSKIMPHIKPLVLRIIFIPFLFLIAFSMLQKAFVLYFG